MPGMAPTRLKLVTVAPGRESFSDVEIPTNQRHLLRKDPYLGSTIDGRYRVEALLGQGGMGVVYRCTHTIIDKKVAMKVLRPDLARDDEVTERFLNEAKAASAVGNPHIIDISDFGQLPDGATYFVMEFLSGTPLSKVTASRQPLPVDRILRIARQLAEGLSAAHAAGIVHRDLKPDNVYLVDRGSEKDFVKILDFGIAKVSTAEQGKLTRAGTVFGTPHYMSPEQASGAPVDHRGDIYSLGVILYELASGHVPFDADNFMGILTQHIYKAPAPLGPPVPEALEAIVMRCLSKRPEARYQSMDELIADIDRVRSGLTPAAAGALIDRSSGFDGPVDYFGNHPLPASPRKPSGPNRWPLFAGLAGALFALGVVLIILVPRGESAAPEPRRAASTPARVTAEPAATPAPTAPAEPTPQVRQVVVAAEPLDAHLFRGDENLGPSPVMLALQEGETVTLVARRSGYKDKKVTVDGSKARHVIKLDRVVSPPRSLVPPKSTAPEKPRRAAIGSGEIVDPWD